MTNKLSDEWQTPKWLFQELEMEHGPFDIDLCARVHNKKCFRYSEDYLNLDIKRVSNEYTKEFNCWMNPPYSNPKPFIEKAWEDSKHCKIVCLVKADPSTKWWATFWNYCNFLCPFCNYGYYDLEECGRCNGEYERRIGAKSGCDYKFFPKRIQFDPPQQLIDSGEVRKVGPKDCIKCRGKGEFISCNPNERYPIPCFECPKSNRWVIKCGSKALCGHRSNVKGCGGSKCRGCKGSGFTTLSGPTFPSALIIMDRRNV